MRICLNAKCDNENVKVDHITAYLKDTEEIKITWKQGDIRVVNGNYSAELSDIEIFCSEKDDGKALMDLLNDAVGFEVQAKNEGISSQEKTDRSFIVSSLSFMEDNIIKEFDPKTVGIVGVDNDIIYWAQHCINSLITENHVTEQVVDNVKKIRNLVSEYKHLDSDEQMQKAQDFIDSIDPCIQQLEDDFSNLKTTKPMEAFYAEAEHSENSAMYMLDYLKDQETREER